MGLSLGDSLAGLFALQGLLAALYRRGQGGGGQEVDVSILESCFAVLESIPTEFDRLGQVRAPTGTRLAGNAPSNVYHARDGRRLVVAANTDPMFARLASAMGRPQLASDGRFATHTARSTNQDALDEEIAAWAGTLDAAEIERRLAEAGVVCGPINSIADVFADEHVQAREMVVAQEDAELGTLVGPAPVPRFSETPGRVRWSARWQPGADNRDVLGGLLGHTDAELDRWREDGVI